MKFLKFIILALSIGLASCSKDDEGSKIEVSFDQSTINIPFSENQQEVIVKLNFDSAAPENTAINLNFGGSAEEPFDYTALR